ncbi:MAG TPA: type II secretion system F family protein [Jatrophihabitans sp.]|uniref:type II secretion system F family protein n=1 Tax=Jatrophihabitans sp. TaxID=1932789 RepID=UPI002EF3B3A8
MPSFSYTATLPSGEPARGTEKAASQEAVELALYERDLRDIRVEPKKSLLKMEITASRVKRDELMHLSRQLAAFIRAGLPLIDAVRTIGAESSNSSVRRMMADVERSLRDGDRLSTCLDRHPKIFPAFYRGILRSAELTGQLDTVLDQLATYLERDLEARRKVQSAMIYPAVIAGMSVFTVAVLAGFVLPRFKVFFKSLDAELPLPTRIMLAITDFLIDYWWAIIAAIVGVVVVLALALRTEAGRYLRDRFVLAAPVLGATVQYALVERFCRILSSMVSAGVNLPEALRVASESLRNLVFIRALSQVGESMLEGDGLAKPLARTGLFPSTASLMMQVGEETGTLDAQLEATARYYEGELDYKIKKLTSLFEPTIILVMGGLVGFVAIALVSAMYGIFNQVSV